MAFSVFCRLLEYNRSRRISIYEQMHFESVQCTYCMLFAPKVGLVDRLVRFTMHSFACNTLKNFAKQLSSTTCQAVLFGSFLEGVLVVWYVMTQSAYSEPYILYGLLHLRKGTILASKRYIIICWW